MIPCEPAIVSSDSAGENQRQGGEFQNKPPAGLTHYPDGNRPFQRPNLKALGHQEESKIMRIDPVTNQPLGLAPTATTAQDEDIVLKELMRHQMVNFFTVSVMQKDPCCFWACGICEGCEAYKTYEEDNVGLTSDGVDKAVKCLDQSAMVTAVTSTCGVISYVGMYACALASMF